MSFSQVLLVVIGVATVFAIPAHLVQIIVLIRYRKSFKTPYFLLLLSLACNDLLFCIFDFSIADIWYLVGRSDLRQTYYPRLSATLVQFYLFVFVAGNEVALVSIAINRFIYLCYPLRAHALWKPHHTKIAIGVQWFLAAALSLTFVHPSGQYFFNGTYSMDNEMFGGMPIRQSYDPNPWLADIRATVCIAMDHICGVSLLGFYSVILVKLIHYKVTKNVAVTEKEGFGTEVKLGAQGFLLSSAVISQAVLFATRGMRMNKALLAAFYFSIYGNFLPGPFISFGMCESLRIHARKLLGGKKVTPKKRGGKQTTKARSVPPTKKVASRKPEITTKL